MDEATLTATIAVDLASADGSVTPCCCQCGRVGTRGFEVIPRGHVHGELVDGAPEMVGPFIVCKSQKACRKRRGRLMKRLRWWWRYEASVWIVVNITHRREMRERTARMHSAIKDAQAKHR